MLRAVESIVDIFFFNDPPTTEIYPLSLHDALPILFADELRPMWVCADFLCVCVSRDSMPCCIVFGIDIRGNGEGERSGEITCRLLAWLQSLIVNQGIRVGGIDQ